MFLTGKDEGAARRMAKHLDHAEADRQLLFGSIRQFIGPSIRGLDVDPRA